MAIKGHKEETEEEEKMGNGATQKVEGKKKGKKEEIIYEKRGG